MELITKVLDYSNIQRAYKQVVTNKGSKGVDGISTKDLHAYMQEHWSRIAQEIAKGHYCPQAVLGVEIPKANGGKRQLGIPTVIDRLIQQAVHQVLQPLYDYEFSDFSYGFRKGKNAHQAILQALNYINQGYQDIIDLDLKKFFDIVNHDYLMSLLNRKIKDRMLLKLIRRFLQSDIMKGGLSEQRRKGTPQGSPLSPLLSNIILNELDKELTKRGLRFIRYADDCSIFVKSKLASERVLNNTVKFIETKLHLQVNQQKTSICRPVNYFVLGYGFVPTYKKAERGKYKLRVSPKSFKTMKQKVKQLTRKTWSLSFDQRISKLNAFITGWVNYYKFANMTTKLKELDTWVRSRLRYCIWKHWRTERKEIVQRTILANVPACRVGNKRKRSFIRLGISQGQAYAWSRSRMGGWAIALSPIMKTTITVERLQKRGYLSFSVQFQKSSRTMLNDLQLKLSFV